MCGAPQTESSIVHSPPLEPSPSEGVATPGIPAWLIVIGSICILLVFFAIISATQSSAPTTVTNTVDLSPKASDPAIDLNTTDVASAPVATPTPEAEPNWSYRTDIDKVRGGTTYFASTTSTNTVSQSAPYDSDTSMTITVRHSPAAGLNIILRISSGQLMCPSYEGCDGTVRFDDGPAETVRFAGPSDDDSQTIFVEGEESFLSKLKKAKHLVIEKTLYQAGAPQFEFDVHGLKWDH